MKVKKWISETEAKEYEEVVGGMGGWFGNGDRWQDYIAIWKKSVRPYLEAIRQSVLDNNFRLTGQDHQDSPHGVPLFEDDTIASFSWRAWGDLMAAIWSEKENKDYCYMSFYM